MCRIALRPRTSPSLHSCNPHAAKESAASQELPSCKLLQFYYLPTHPGVLLHVVLEFISHRIRSNYELMHSAFSRVETHQFVQSTYDLLTDLLGNYLPV
jgi:hypothetical protein